MYALAVAAPGCSMFPLKLPDTESQLSCISMPAIFWPAGLTNKEVAELTGLGRNVVKKIDRARLQELYTHSGRKAY